MIARLFAWVVFLVVCVGLVRLVAATGNPWGSVATIKPTAEALHIPGCADKLECRD